MTSPLTSASGRLPRWLRVTALEVLAVGVPLGAVLLAPPSPDRTALPTAVAACLLLPVRLRWPWLAVLACLPALAGGLGWPASVVALYRLGRVSHRQPVLVAWVLVAAAAAAAPVQLEQHLPWSRFTLTVLFALGLAAAPAAVGALTRVRAELTASLAEVRRAREAELAAREEGARAAERARIGREIHDAVGHHATLIAVESAALVATTAEPATRETARRVRALAKQSLAEMRAALAGASDPGQVPHGLADLGALADNARSVGLSVRLDDRVPAGLTVPATVERAVYRLVQEALTNVTRHAPGAPVWIRLAERTGALEVSVVNGRPVFGGNGADGLSGGTGLAGLAERVRLAGGALRAEPGADGGFTVAATLPLAATSDPAVPTGDAVEGSAVPDPADATGDAVPDPAGATGDASKVDSDDSTFGGSAQQRAHT